MSSPFYFEGRAETLRAEAQRDRQARAARPERPTRSPLSGLLNLLRPARLA